MQTTAIGTVAKSLPQNVVILLTLLIPKRYIPYTDLLKEFVAESKAWWAYLRFNKEFELIETLKGREGEKNVTLWPIAPACLNTNPNITQTEGYK